MDLLNEFNVRTIQIPNQGFGATRDLAYQHAGGKLVVNLSQDAIPMYNQWLDNLITPLGKNEQIAIS